MTKLSIAQALKLKNRIIGEIARLQKVFVRENSRRSDSMSKVDVEKAFAELQNNLKGLIVIKAKIAQANQPIYHRIEEMAQTKAFATFLSGVTSREGEEKVSIGFSKEIDTFTWTSFMNEEALEKKVLELQNSIAQIQDELDNFNATNDIEVEIISSGAQAPADNPPEAK